MNDFIQFVRFWRSHSVLLYSNRASVLVWPSSFENLCFCLCLAVFVYFELVFAVFGLALLFLSLFLLFWGLFCYFCLCFCWKPLFTKGWKNKNRQPDSKNIVTGDFRKDGMRVYNDSKYDKSWKEIPGTWQKSPNWHIKRDNPIRLKARWEKHCPVVLLAGWGQGLGAGLWFYRFVTTFGTSLRFSTISNQIHEVDWIANRVQGKSNAAWMYSRGHQWKITLEPSKRNCLLLFKVKRWQFSSVLNAVKRIYFSKLCCKKKPLKK